MTVAFMRTISAALFGLAAWTVLRLAAAEVLFRQDTVASIERAMAYDGDCPNEAFQLRLAQEDRVNAARHLARIVKTVNPRSSAAWISLGLNEEAQGHWPEAESDLAEAARIDHQYLPAWTLTNFYFRQGRSTAFWLWAERAAELSVDRFAYSDLSLLLELSDGFEADPDKLLAHFKCANKLRPAYLNYLIVAGRLDDAQRVALGMTKDPANAPHLVDLADRQIDAGNGRAAIDIWNASSGLPPLDPASGRILSNGDLNRAPMNLGFDWRLARVDGVDPVWRPAELVVHLSGSQPESCTLLEQMVLLPSRCFRLSFDYTTGSSPLRGLRWSLDRSEGAELESTRQWRRGSFDLPALNGLRSLRLIYRRELGTTRTEGSMEIRNLRLDPATQAEYDHSHNLSRDHRN